MPRLSRIATTPTKRNTAPIARLPSIREITPEVPLQNESKRTLFDSHGYISSDSADSTITVTNNSNATFDPVAFKTVSKRFLPHGTSPGEFGVMSPNNRFICTLGSDGLVSILDAISGSLVGCLNFDRKYSATSVTWFSSTEIAIGCVGGYVLGARLILESRLADETRLATITDIGTCIKGDPPTFLTFDSGLGLLAALTNNTITIWRRILDPEHRGKQIWEHVQGGRGLLRSVGYTACFFGKNVNKCLFIGTNDGYAIWSYQTKKIQWNVVGAYPIGRCTVSPGGRFLAATKSNFELIIWPVQISGISCAERSALVIPTGREWITGATFPPVHFVDDNTILTADPIGNVYFVTARAEVMVRFSCGINYHIRSLFWTPVYLYVLSLGPGGATVISSLTDNEACFQNNYKRKAVNLANGEPFVIQDVKLPIIVAPPSTQETGTGKVTKKHFENRDHNRNVGLKHFSELFESKVDLKTTAWAFVLSFIVLNYPSAIQLVLTLTGPFGFIYQVVLTVFILAILFVTLSKSESSY